MDKTDLRITGNLLLIASVLLTWIMTMIFAPEIRAFMDYHFTREFVILVIKWVMLTIWLSCFVLGVVFLLYSKRKE